MDPDLVDITQNNEFCLELFLGLQRWQTCHIIASVQECWSYCRTGHSYVGAWYWTDQTCQIPWGPMDYFHGTPSLDCSHLSLVDSLIKSILVLLAKLFLHSHSLNSFQVESARSSSSSCHAVSLYWAKGLSAETLPDRFLLNSFSSKLPPLQIKY